VKVTCSVQPSLKSTKRGQVRLPSQLADLPEPLAETVPEPSGQIPPTERLVPSTLTLIEVG